MEKGEIIPYFNQVMTYAVVSNTSHGGIALVSFADEIKSSIHMARWSGLLVRLREVNARVVPTTITELDEGHEWIRHLHREISKLNPVEVFCVSSRPLSENQVRSQMAKLHL
jgi:Mor family transcriptional regulator